MAVETLSKATQLYVGLRLRNKSEAKKAFQYHAEKIIRSEINASRDPFLANAIEGLELGFKVDGRKLFTACVEVSGKDAAYFNQFAEVEFAIEAEKVQAGHKQYANYKGADYIEACHKWGKKNLAKKSQSRKLPA